MGRMFCERSEGSIEESTLHGFTNKEEVVEEETLQ